MGRHGVVRRGGVPLAVLGFLLFAGCAHHAPGPVVSATEPSQAPSAAVQPAEKPVPELPPTPSSADEPAEIPPASPADLAYAEGKTEMDKGNYERALESFASAWKDRPGHPGVAKDFSEALSSLKTSGDEAYRQGRLEEAGRLWSGALRFSSHPAEKGKSLPFGKTDIRDSIDRISSTLMEKGLVEYRKGNLQAAIAAWKSILSYDPSHAEASRSVATATTQLENLKKIPPAK